MKQLTITMDDKVGVLADISYILGKAKINIESVSAEAYGGKVVINLTVKDDKRAAELLAASGYKALESDVLVVKVKDAPGELSKISTRLKDANIDIQSLFILARGDGYSLDVFKVDKPKAARKILADCILQG
ncbi:MAG: ACT domain-containing protein [Candidatus Micrarchaeia archaeon]